MLESVLGRESVSFFDNFLSAIDDVVDASVSAVATGANRAKCLFGSHDWMNWSYKKDGNCEQGRYCRRVNCSKTETRTEHGWTDFAYTADAQCRQERNCPRCQSSEDRMSHEDWSDWHYDRDGDCAQSKQCVRCNEASTQTTHIWGSWELDGIDTCNRVRRCERCPTGREFNEATHSDHRYEPYLRTNCYTRSMRCTRCSKMGPLPHFDEEHDYGEWRRDPERGFRWRKCRKCGDQEIE